MNKNFRANYNIVKRDVRSPELMINDQSIRNMHNNSSIRDYSINNKIDSF